MDWHFSLIVLNCLHPFHMPWLIYHHPCTVSLELYLFPSLWWTIMSCIAVKKSWAVLCFLTLNRNLKRKENIPRMKLWGPFFWTELHTLFGKLSYTTVNINHHHRSPPSLLSITPGSSRTICSGSIQKDTCCFFVVLPVWFGRFLFFYNKENCSVVSLAEKALLHKDFYERPSVAT